ncbi:MAG: TSUP family transporter [Propionicimonas sp.]|uniref:sulfite exporter TauE/SafE family protein n=1 Tax=Propionicimonas sp. TaxID=1955623 RepID=UPI002B2071B5|nr:TSUP family transporter [Propionicimonas sp.]MEA4945737.1 TSUP family transporter [Propionicimonas sp.]MEA5118277.1 TSUP family transporter [Propionicimonas sp.]
MPELGLEGLLLLIVSAFLAGTVDAVVGGGGLIQLPALMVAFPGAAPVQLLATNKLGSIAGTSTSSITYYRRVHPDLRTALPLAVAAFAGSALGAVVASQIPRAAFNPIVLIALLVVGAYVIFKPEVGRVEQLRHSGRRHYLAAAVTGAGIGFYDGALGPGTGSFLVFALVGWLGYAFLEASAKAKIANFATNLAALVIFIPQGAVMWKYGLMIAAANLAGGYVGARVAVAKGVRFIRVVFIVVVAAFAVKIGWDLAHPA